jgi:hypothetical protein
MALRKRESKLFDRIKKNIKNVHFTRIESSYQTLSESAIETYRVKGVIHSSTIPQLDLELVHTTPDPVPVSHWTELRSVLLT